MQNYGDFACFFKICHNLRVSFTMNGTLTTLQSLAHICTYAESCEISFKPGMSCKVEKIRTFSSRVLDLGLEMEMKLGLALGLGLGTVGAVAVKAEARKSWIGVV